MRNDLLPSQNVVEWAITQIDLLEAELSAWVATKPYTVETNFDTDRGMYSFEPIPGEAPKLVNVHVGIIIHALRSSLDILAVTLAQRNGVSELKKLNDTYFPIGDGLRGFALAKSKKIKWLSTSDIAKIEMLKPYKGGNDLFFGPPPNGHYAKAYTSHSRWSSEQLGGLVRLGRGHRKIRLQAC